MRQEWIQRSKSKLQTYHRCTAWHNQLNRARCFCTFLVIGRIFISSVRIWIGNCKLKPVNLFFRVNYQTPIRFIKFLFPVVTWLASVELFMKSLLWFLWLNFLVFDFVLLQIYKGNQYNLVNLNYYIQENVSFYMVF